MIRWYNSEEIDNVVYRRKEMKKICFIFVSYVAILLALASCNPSGGSTIFGPVDYTYDNYTGSETLVFFDSDSLRSISGGSGLYVIDENGDYNPVILSGAGKSWQVN